MRTLSLKKRGEVSATWDCPATPLVTTDRIRIRQRVMVGSLSVTKTWDTEQLGADRLDPATWTFYRIVATLSANRELMPSLAELQYGAKIGEGETRVVNFAWSKYIDAGLRFYDGTRIVKIACEPKETLTSPLRIHKNETIYGVVLVKPSDTYASKLFIKTSSGIKALRKL